MYALITVTSFIWVFFLPLCTLFKMGFSSDHIAKVCSFSLVVTGNNIKRYCLPKLEVLRKKLFGCAAFSLAQTRALCFVFLYGEKGHVHFLLIKLLFEYEILNHNTVE